MSNKRSAISGTHIWLVMTKAHRSLMRHAERSHQADDIGLSDFVVLEMLLHKGPQKVNEIGRRVALTSGAITTAVDRVEPDPLVSLADIAERAGLTRAAITNYFKGSRGKNFPPPVAKVTSDSPLWDWADVAYWMASNAKVSVETSI